MKFEKTKPLPARLNQWVGPTPPDRVVASIERARLLDDVVHVAVMPDVHLAHGVCIGTVLATTRRLYPGVVGGDIGCGMAAMQFDANASILEKPAVGKMLLKGLSRVVPMNRHRKALPVVLSSRHRMSDRTLDRVLLGDGRRQLGTLGGGNHFLELQRDVKDGSLWVMVHSGSRGLGPKVSCHHIACCTERSHGMPVLDANSEKGRAFWRDLHAARAYARLNRALMIQATAWMIRECFGVEPQKGTFVQCDHNHICRERHGGRWLYVHRKGAARARQNQPGLIPGSMGSPSYHVLGRGHPGALCSSSHGAGRAMSRTEARRTVSMGGLRRQTAGVHTNPMQHARLREEAPQAYKDIRQVMRYQRELVTVTREMEPVLSYKGG